MKQQYRHEYTPKQIVAAQPGTRVMFRSEEDAVGYWLGKVTCYAICRVVSVGLIDRSEEDQGVEILPCDKGLNGPIEPIPPYGDGYLGIVMPDDDPDEMYRALTAHENDGRPKP